MDFTCRLGHWLILGTLTAGCVSACSGDKEEPPPSDDGAAGEADEAGAGGATGGSGGSSGIGGNPGTAGRGEGGAAAGGAELGGTSSGGTGATAGTAGSGGTAGTAGAGTGGAGAGDVLTNPAGIPFEVTSSAPGLVLLSSNLVQEPSGSGAFQQWFAEIKNNGTSPSCFVELEISFESAAGLEIIGFHAYADAAAYESSSGSDLTIPCIPPGKTGGVYSNDLGPSVDLAAIESAIVAVNDLPGNYTPHRSAPVVTSAVAGPHSVIGSDWWAVSGVVTAAATVRNLGMQVYPRSATSGLLVDQLSDTHLDVLAQGETWAYETLGHEGEHYTEFLQFVDFIAGSTLASPMAFGSADVPGANTVGEHHRRWRGFVGERKARLEQVRAR